MGGDLGTFLISQTGYAAINDLLDILSCTQPHIFVIPFAAPYRTGCLAPLPDAPAPAALAGSGSGLLHSPCWHLPRYQWKNSPYNRPAYPMGKIFSNGEIYAQK